MGMAVSDNFTLPFLSGPVYDALKDYAATVVLIAVTIAAMRRAFFKPARYAVPARFGKDHTPDAIFLLALIGLLMVADGFFDGSKAAAEVRGRRRFRGV